MGGLFVVTGGGESFPVRRREWGDRALQAGGLATRICSVLGARLGVGTGCCRGWEGFLARGGVPSAGGVSRGMMLQAIGEVPLPARRHSR